MAINQALQQSSRPSAQAATGKRLPRERRGEQLLDVAVQMFIERGYQGTSMEDIASAAGVSRPIIYNHYGNKDGIYLACLRRARQELDRLIAENALPHHTPESRLRGGIVGYFAFVESNRESWSILFGGGVAVAGNAAQEAAELRNETVRGIAKLLGGVSPAVTPEALEAFSHAASGAGEQLAKWWQGNPKLARDSLVDYLMAFAWPGLQSLISGPVHGKGKPAAKKTVRALSKRSSPLP